MADSQKLLRSLSDEFQSLQKDLSTVVEARQKLESQLQENQSVQKEFAGLEDDAKIYKLVGPVLLKQDKAEAVMNVDKRLEYIQSEMCVDAEPLGVSVQLADITVDRERIEGQIKEIGDKQDKKKMEIMQVQQQFQQAAEAAEG